MGKLYDATWGRFFSAIYDRCMASTEEEGLREMRQELLAAARGRVLELGAGTGLNLEHYSEGVTDLTMAEPDPHMTKQLRRRLQTAERDAAVVEAPAEALPFRDDSFDTAVATLVLCTVPDPAAATSEIRRVLKPGGRFLFLEHVRSEDPGLARWQDRLERPWRFLGDGCHCNRDTLATLRGAGFEVPEVERDQLPKAPPLVRPLIRGSAVPAG
jgi:ubiquinone/menaquinone biosynthesis C-methylase UbiE